MSLTLLFATTNKNKISEVERYAKRDGVNLLKPIDVLSMVPEIDEIAATYVGNAHLKAEAFGKLYPNGFVVADDSGIEVAALNGAPGVQSARFAGESATDAQRCMKLLSLLEGVQDRAACMRCIFCVRLPNGLFLIAEGVMPGSIALEHRGEKGWGYEPVFIPEGEHYTISELKDRSLPYRTHRELAWEQLMNGLASISREVLKSFERYSLPR
jgi:XTP/dITP diphosphohydrolase